jgi:hypothetical protein
MSTEYHAFLDDTKAKSPDAILEASYQKVFMEDLLLAVENGDFSDEQIDALLSLETPLADLYWNWLDTDHSYMDMLRDRVDEYANAVISEQKAEKSAPTPEKEPQKPTSQKPKQPYTLLGDLRETQAEVHARKAEKTAVPTKTKTKIPEEL